MSESRIAGSETKLVESLPVALCYYHPTTVVSVDDNQRYVSDLELVMPDTVRYRAFHNPETALAHVNQFESKASLASRSMVPDAASHTSAIRVDYDTISSEIADPNRHAIPSVIITDYSMPSMDGLELCRRILLRNAKRILVTGVADEKTAVRAFNAREIDAFVMKGANDAIDQIVKLTLTLQLQFFRDEQSALWRTLVASGRSFLEDPVIADTMNSLLRKGYREYYLLSSKEGYLLIAQDGSAHWALIQSVEESDQIWRTAEAHNAPAAVVQRLKSHEYLAHLPDEFIDSHSLDNVSWESCITKASRIEGTVPWLFGILTEPPLEIDVII